MCDRRENLRENPEFRKMLRDEVKALEEKPQELDVARKIAEKLAKHYGFETCPKWIVTAVFAEIDRRDIEVVNDDDEPDGDLQ